MGFEVPRGPGSAVTPVSLKPCGPRDNRSVRDTVMLVLKTAARLAAAVEFRYHNSYTLPFGGGGVGPKMREVLPDFATSSVASSLTFCLGDKWISESPLLFAA